MSSANMETQRVNVQQCRYFSGWVRRHASSCLLDKMSIISWAHIYSTPDICLQVKEKHMLARTDDVGLDPLRALNCSMTLRDGRWRWPKGRPLGCLVSQWGDTSTRFRPFPRLIDTRIMRVHPSLAFSAVVGILLSSLFSLSERASALWSLNNFARLFSSSLYLHFFVAATLTTTAWVPAWLQPVCDGLSLLSNGSYTHAAEGLPLP